MDAGNRIEIDLATEVGESSVLPPAGLTLAEWSRLDLDGRRLHPRHAMPRDDEALLAMVSTAYVACGAHAGDAITMGRTVRDLAARGVAIGAHPSYPDYFGFGQESLPLPDVDVDSVQHGQPAVSRAHRI